MKSFISDIQTALKKDLPGEHAQLKMAPSFRNNYKSDNISQDAAVMILLYPKEKSINTILIKRTVYNGPHSGQISLPGGKKEKKDQDLIETAVRECYEEIGIAPSNIKIIGNLTPLHIPISNYMVHPIVGVSYNTPSFSPNPIEVDQILELNLHDLFNPKNKSNKHFIIDNTSFIAPVFNPNDVIIWGATAMILSEFNELYNSINPMF